MPINLVGAGRECEDRLGPHWQVSLIIIGQGGHRGTKSLLTLMLYVPASAFNFLQKICCLGTTSKRKKKTSWIFSRYFEGDIQGLYGQMVIKADHEYLRVSGPDKCMHGVPVGRDHYQSMRSLLTAGESISGDAWYTSLDKNPWVGQSTWSPWRCPWKYSSKIFSIVILSLVPVFI